MEQAKTQKAERKPLPEIKGRVCNELLLCRKYESDEKVKGLYLATEDKSIDLTESIAKKAEVVLVSPKLVPYMEDFNPGDILCLSPGSRHMEIWIDDEKYFFVAKKDVIYVEGR